MGEKNAKRGFTIIEIVIVIAAMGILAAVLIPSFSGIFSKSKSDGAMQECNSALIVVIGNENVGLYADKLYFVTKDGYVFAGDVDQDGNINVRELNSGEKGLEEKYDDRADAINYLLTDQNGGLQKVYTDDEELAESNGFSVRPMFDEDLKACGVTVFIY